MVGFAIVECKDEVLDSVSITVDSAGECSVAIVAEAVEFNACEIDISTEGVCSRGVLANVEEILYGVDCFLFTAQ